MSISTPLPAPGEIRLPASIIRVPAGADWTVVVTSHKAATCWTHFIDGRTQYCRSPAHECRACEMDLNRRWEAYISADVRARGGVAVLTIPQMAWWSIEKSLPQGRETDLRGYRVRLTRPGTDPRSRLLAEVVGKVPVGERIGRGLDVPLILARAWRVPRELLDA